MCVWQVYIWYVWFEMYVMKCTFILIKLFNKINQSYDILTNNSYFYKKFQTLDFTPCSLQAQNAVLQTIMADQFSLLTALALVIVVMMMTTVRTTSAVTNFTCPSNYTTSALYRSSCGPNTHYTCHGSNASSSCPCMYNLVLKFNISGQLQYFFEWLIFYPEIYYLVFLYIFANGVDRNFYLLWSVHWSGLIHWMTLWHSMTIM